MSKTVRYVTRRRRTEMAVRFIQIAQKQIAQLGVADDLYSGDYIVVSSEDERLKHSFNGRTSPTLQGEGASTWRGCFGASRSQKHVIYFQHVGTRKKRWWLQQRWRLWALFWTLPIVRLYTQTTLQAITFGFLTALLCNREWQASLVTFNQTLDEATSVQVIALDCT